MKYLGIFWRDYRASFLSSWRHGLIAALLGITLGATLFWLGAWTQWH